MKVQVTCALWFDAGEEEAIRAVLPELKMVARQLGPLGYCCHGVTAEQYECVVKLLEGLQTCLTCSRVDNVKG